MTLMWPHYRQQTSFPGTAYPSNWHMRVPPRSLWASQAVRAGGVGVLEEVLDIAWAWKIHDHVVQFG